MTAFPGQGAPIPGPRDQDGDKYAQWDAAYVLGALSEMDRREFDAHLGECPACREGVTELSGVPALLSLLDLDEMHRRIRPVCGFGRRGRSRGWSVDSGKCPPLRACWIVRLMATARWSVWSARLA